MENIEVKINLDNFAKIRRSLKNLGCKYCGILRIEDVYFSVPRGRLKLRRINKEICQLIFYQRKDSKSSRPSAWEMLLDGSPADLKPIKEILTKVCGIKAVVNNRRELWMYRDSTRVHLDRPLNLDGRQMFLELETAVGRRGRSDAMKENQGLIRVLKLESSERIPYSYSDMILRNKKSNR